MHTLRTPSTCCTPEYSFVSPLGCLEDTLRINRGASSCKNIFSITKGHEKLKKLTPPFWTGIQFQPYSDIGGAALTLPHRLRCQIFFESSKSNTKAERPRSSSDTVPCQCELEAARRCDGGTSEIPLYHCREKYCTHACFVNTIDLLHP